MGEKFREVLLAAYNSRSCVTRGRDGTIHLLWATLGMRMSQGEFVSFVRLVTEAVACPARCGELASGSYGRVARCSMGQIMLSYDRLTLWFSPEEFQEFCRLIVEARQRLADTEPPPILGAPWTPPQGEIFTLN
jgi:hypothetical protein